MNWDLHRGVNMQVGLGLTKFILQPNKKNIILVESSLFFFCLNSTQTNLITFELFGSSQWV